MLPHTGGEAPPYPRLREVLGGNGIVCLLGERDLTSRGVEVDFFGETTTFPAGPAKLAIDTGAAHLAAALGARTWVILRHAGDWRYGTAAKDGERCPWSPTMRLFRQDASRRWEPVLDAVSAALQDLA